MNFKEIARALKEGKKIRRANWNYDHFWQLDRNDNITNSKGEIVNDWVIMANIQCSDKNCESHKFDTYFVGMSVWKYCPFCGSELFKK